MLYASFQGIKEREHKIDCQGHYRLVSDPLASNMFWGEGEKHQCTTSATWEYTTPHQNLPADSWPAHQADVLAILPCSKSGIVHSGWEVNQDEADCVPLWDWYEDKDCVHHGDD